MNRLASRPGHVLAIVITLGIANHTALAGSRVAVSLSALAMGASAFTVGALMAVFALLPMLCAVSVGRLSDRIGVRWPMLIGSIGVALGASISFVWTSMWALFASALLTGVSFMTFQLSTQRVAGELGDPANRMRNFGLLALGYSVSGFTGPLLSGFSIDHFGFPVAFAVAAVIALLPIAVLGSGRLPLPGPQPVPASGHQGGVGALLRHRALRQTYAINVLLAAAWDMHQTFVPIYGARKGLSASEIGVVLAAFAAATFLIRALMPILMRRQTEHQVLTLSLYIAGVVYLLFPFSQSALALSVLSFVLGLGLGAGQPMVMSLLHTHAPASRVGEAVGVRMSLVQTSSVAVPLLFGAVGSSLGLGPVFWSVGVCLTGGGYYWRRGVHR